MSFFFGTPLGRSIFAAIALSLGLAIGWRLFASHYEAKGREVCRGEQARALEKANAEQTAKNTKTKEAGKTAEKDAAAAAAAAGVQADKESAKTKEVIRYVYAKPPKSSPVSADSCVYPVDERMQNAIDAAVRRANSSSD